MFYQTVDSFYTRQIRQDLHKVRLTKDMKTFHEQKKPLKDRKKKLIDVSSEGPSSGD